ncbi:MAG: BspA family leucine-rich repeat surface protein [Bacteroidales bacterium]
MKKSLLIILLGALFPCFLIAQKPFVAKWRSDKNGLVKIFTSEEFKYKFSVDWDNDGIYDESNIDCSISHQYNGKSKDYTIAIKGDFPHINYQNFLVDVCQWGDIKWKSMEMAFLKNDLIEYFSAEDVPNLLDVKSIRSMLYGATKFNGDIGRWDVSSVEIMYGLFLGASMFNKDLSDWDVSKVKDMSLMFADALSFNQNLNDWDVGKVKTMEGMFYGAKTFNQDIGNWNVSRVDNMSFMFTNALMFDQNLSDWNVGNVNSMRNMFSGAKKFQGEISLWDIVGVYDMANMFTDVSLSTEVYNRILIAWSELPVTFHIWFNAGNTYFSGEEARKAREKLTNECDWIITDLGEKTVGIEENKENLEKKTLIYPNPSCGKIYLQIPDIKQWPIEIRIINSKGFEVYNKICSNSNIQLNLDSGVYVMILRQEDKIYTEKLVIK